MSEIGGQLRRAGGDVGSLLAAFELDPKAASRLLLEVADDPERAVPALATLCFAVVTLVKAADAVGLTASESMDGFLDGLSAADGSDG